MRNWKTILKSLAERPLGSSADGRMVGLSLGAALDGDRNRMVTDVEAYANTAEARGNANSF